MSSQVTEETIMSALRYQILRQDAQCPDTNSCEKMIQFADTPPGTRHFIFKVETDPAKLTEMRELIGPGEALGYTTLIPDVT